MAFNFSANDYETKSVGQSIPVLPAGVYKCIIDKCTLEPGQRSENSSNVKVLYTVTEGEFKDSKIFQNIVYENQSDAAVAIGRAMLAKICKCVNKLVLHQGPEELKGSELFVELVVENYKEKNKDVNRVYNVYGIDPITGEKVDPDGSTTSATPANTNVPPAGFGVQTKK